MWECFRDFAAEFVPVCFFVVENLNGLGASRRGVANKLSNER
jgi:hypothetical protein